MATDIRNLIGFFSSDADFRAWGSGIAAQLAAIGLVKTADTGQIDWSTVLRPTANNYAGYEIWRFNDSFQATAPVFIKIEYGAGSPVDRPNLRVQVSSATNGAGTPTGQVGGISTMSLQFSRLAGQFGISFCTGDAGKLNLVNGWDNSYTYFHVICVERTQTAAGVRTGDGIVVLTGYGSNGAVRFQVIPTVGSVPNASSQGNCAATFATGSSSVGPKIALSPTVACLGKPFYASWAAYGFNDLVAGYPVSVDHLGAVRTMMPLGMPSFASNGWTQGSSTIGAGLAIVWE